MVKALYEGRLAVDIAGLKMQTPVTTGSGTFGFGLEFTDFLDLEKVGAVTVKALPCCLQLVTKVNALWKLRPVCLTASAWKTPVANISWKKLCLNCVNMMYL